MSGIGGGRTGNGGPPDERDDKHSEAAQTGASRVRLPEQRRTRLASCLSTHNVLDTLTDSTKGRPLASRVCKESRR